MLDQIEALVAQDRDFVLETTLSSKMYALRIRDWRASGYVVGSITSGYQTLRRQSPGFRRRGAAGGHDIPERTLRRRFTKSLQNLDAIYKPIVSWWDSPRGRL